MKKTIPNVLSLAKENLTENESMSFAFKKSSYPSLELFFKYSNYSSIEDQ